MRIFVKEIVPDPEAATAVVRIRKFPLPASAGSGNSSFSMVAGARFAREKIDWPPVEELCLMLTKQGKAFVPEKS